MELYCDQEPLAVALKVVLPAVPSHPLVMTGTGVLLRADGHLDVIALDQKMTIRCRVGAQVTRPGEVVLPARTITELAAMLDADRIDAALDEEAQACPEQGRRVLALRCGRTLAHVRGWKAEEFPSTPLVY